MKNTTSGLVHFENDIEELGGIAEIAKEPDVRFNMWICKQFKVLPTSPDFINLTSEQKTLIWEDYLLDNPKIKEEIERREADENDDEFNELWDNNELEFSDLTEDVNIEKVQENFSKIDEREHDEIQYPTHAKRVFEQIEKHRKEQQRIKNLNNSDWDDIEIDLSQIDLDDDEFSEV